MAQKRLSVSLDSELDQRIEDLMKETGTRTKAEFLNYAIAMLDWAISEATDGRSVASVDRNAKEIKELEMPPLRIARRKAERKG